jgi:hypothetical protein
MFLQQQWLQWRPTYSLSLSCTHHAATLATAACRYTHLHISITLLGRANVIAECFTFNLDTMQSDPATLAAATQRTLDLPPDLQLTPQQCDTISTGVDMYLSLLENIQKEQQSLQAQLAALATSTRSADAAAEVSSSSAGANLHVQQLEQQQDMCRRMQALLQKEYVLQFMVCGWLLGCLSCEQLARACVLAWPYTLRMSQVGIGIRKWHRQQQQQQE